MHDPRQRLIFVASVIGLALLVATCNGLKRDDGKPVIQNSAGKEFAGSESCATCHKATSETHKLTAHFKTSSLVDVAHASGNFAPPHNTFALNERLKVVMEKSSDSLFQSGVVDGWEAIKKPMQLVIGAGRKAQTFLYWDEDKLFELPVSYYTPLNAWCNSPGYPNDRILFDRAITARCFECHGTFARTITKDKVDRFDKDQMILGIDCERCHGPAKGHVDFHTQNPNIRQANAIINPSKLSRQLRLDNCALCHSGVRKPLKPAFSFTVGEHLETHSAPDYKQDSVAALDVHGNQYGLLTSSKCFIASEMDCSSCHNVHVNETQRLDLFSQRCMTCHQQTNHSFEKKSNKIRLALTNNCIDCHMPALPSRQIFLQVEDKKQSSPEFVRTHRIAVYQKETEKFLERIKSSP